MIAPGCTTEQRRAARNQTYAKPPKVCVVTGGTGFVGQRLVEMLVERGAEKVVSFDIVPPPPGAWRDARIEYVTGDITDKAAVARACAGADCVWHIAACVGPFHPKPLYEKVNYNGTLNVIEACKLHKVPKIVMSSSPSTRMDGSDIDGLTEAQLPSLPMTSYLQEYAKTKAMGELACRRANSDDLLTCAIAPHQVYGPRDNLFMPNMLEAAGSGKLRVFAKASTGWGMNKVCFTHVDNYCHGLILAERALKRKSPVAGNFYIVTDAHTHTHSEGYGYMWKEIDKAIVGMGFASIWDKIKLPYWFLMIVAYICVVVGWILGKKLKLNPFNIKVMTMHRWFKADAAVRDLGYAPIIPFAAGWSDTIAWFRTHWLPKFRGNGEDRFFGIAKQSLRKIEIQDKGVRGGGASATVKRKTR
eukprot:g2412.t1